MAATQTAQPPFIIADPHGDLNSKKAGVVSGTVHEKFATTQIPGATITKFTDQSSANGRRRYLPDAVQQVVQASAVRQAHRVPAWPGEGVSLGIPVGLSRPEGAPKGAPS